MGLSDAFLGTFGLRANPRRVVAYDDYEPTGWTVQLHGASDAQEERFADLAYRHGAVKTAGGDGWLGAHFRRSHAAAAQAVWNQTGARHPTSRVELTRLRPDFTPRQTWVWRPRAGR